MNLLTIEALKALKAKWLVDHKQDIETLFLVTRQMGTVMDDRGRPAYILELGNTHAIYQERQGPWLTDEKKFDDIKVIIIRVGPGHWWEGRVACRYLTGTTINPNDNIFVPGDWIIPFSNLREQATKKLQTAILSAQEVERQKLLKELWINDDQN